MAIETRRMELVISKKNFLGVSDRNGDRKRPVTQRAPSSVFDPPRSGAGRRASTCASWADFLVDSSHDHSSIEGGLGLRFRGPVAGPEQALVETFLHTATIRLLPGRSLTVFAEPAMDTGFPDLVAVVWRRELARGWTSERERLRAMDLRLLHGYTRPASQDRRFLASVSVAVPPASSPRGGVFLGNYRGAARKAHANRLAKHGNRNNRHRHLLRD